MKIGILFPTAFRDPGEYLADARAFEAAGADRIFVEATADADPLVLLGALAAVTGRVALGVIAQTEAERRVLSEDPRLRTVQRLARERVAIGVRTPGGVALNGERWVPVGLPADRQAWQTALAEAGRDGVIVAADPRLVDLLRHPVEEGDRGDLMLSTG
ncbi:MAG TPA: hypothetical protein VET65_04830 [Candidatus Limnocylindrales bacterium]|nr:hypothetical protein [Candidatus Limnocylindrales bacterium]